MFFVHQEFFCFLQFIALQTLLRHSWNKKTVVEIYLCITLESSGNIIFFPKKISDKLFHSIESKKITRAHNSLIDDEIENTHFSNISEFVDDTPENPKTKKKIQTSFVATNKQKVKLSATNTRNRIFSYFFFFFVPNKHYFLVEHQYVWLLYSCDFYRISEIKTRRDKLIVMCVRRDDCAATISNSVGDLD